IRTAAQVPLSSDGCYAKDGTPTDRAPRPPPLRDVLILRHDVGPRYGAIDTDISHNMQILGRSLRPNADIAGPRNSGTFRVARAKHDRLSATMGDHDREIPRGRSIELHAAADSGMRPAGRRTLRKIRDGP